MLAIRLITTLDAFHPSLRQRLASGELEFGQLGGLLGWNLGGKSNSRTNLATQTWPFAAKETR